MRRRVVATISILSVFALGAGAVFFGGHETMEMHSGVTALAADAHVMWYNRPSVARYADRTFIGWATAARHVEVATILGQDRKVSSVARLHRYRFRDDHGSPALHVLQHGNHAGKLLAAYALHNTELYLRRSKRVGDASAWSDEAMILACECTYPSIAETGSTLLLFYRSAVEIGSQTRSFFVMRSRDGGDSWSSPREIIKARSGHWIYGFAEVTQGGAIHLVWGDQPADAADLQNIYYALIDSGAIEQEVSSGSEDVLPLDGSDERNLLFRSSHGRSTRVWDVRIAAPGEVQIAFVDYDDTEAKAKLSRAKNHAFQVLEVGPVATAYYPCGIVFGEGNSAYVSRKDKAGGAVVKKLVFDDRLTSFQESEVLPSSGGAVHCRPIYVGAPGVEVAAHQVNEYSSFMKFATRLLGLTARTDAN